MSAEEMEWIQFPPSSISSGVSKHEQQKLPVRSLIVSKSFSSNLTEKVSALSDFHVSLN